MPEAKNPTTNYDSPWKDTIQQFLRPFLALCFPHVEREISWEREPEFLEQELREETPGSDLGKQCVDQLIRVWRLDGAEQWVLLHIEVQAQPDPDLPLRLLQYHSRLTQKYGWPVVTLCLLADTSADYRPEAFRYDFWRCSLHFEFPFCKLLDFNENELAISGNPVAMVIRAHLTAKRTRIEDPIRYEAKRALLKELLQHGFTHDDISRLLRLIDWLIRLKDESALELRREIGEYYTQNHMPYVTTFERFAKEEGREIGIEEGRLKGLRASILTVAAARFTRFPEALTERLALVNDEAVLNQVLSLAAQSGTYEELDRSLDSLGI